MALVRGAELGRRTFHVAYWDRFGRPDKPIRRASTSTHGGSTRQIRRERRGEAAVTRRPAPPSARGAERLSPRDGVERVTDVLMTAYLFRRLLLVVPTLFGIIAINFVVIQFAPGGPVEQMIAELKARQGRPSITGSAPPRSRIGGSGSYRGARGLDPHMIADIKKMFGFDKPPLTRFIDMVGGYLRFDFGRSFFRDQTVLQLVLQKMPVSISLGLWSTLLVYLRVDPARHRQGGARRQPIRVASSAVVLIGYAVPGFLFAILLVVLFAGGSFFQWFPLRGLTSEGATDWSRPARVADYFWHMVLPTVASWQAVSPALRC